MAHAKHQAGFTALELIVVLGLMSIMAGVAANGVLGAQRRAKVNEAVSAVEQAVSHARVLARGNTVGDNYEVIISGDPDDKGVRVMHEGELIFRYDFGPQVHFFVDGNLYSGSKTIYFAKGTGFTSNSKTTVGQRTTLGTDEDLVLATPDGLVAFQFSIYEVGLVRTVELER